MNLITVEGTITAGFGVIAYNLWSLANMWPPGCQVHYLRVVWLIFCSHHVYEYAFQAVMDLVLKNKAVKDTFGEPVTVVRGRPSLLPMRYFARLVNCVSSTQGWQWDGELLPDSVAVHIPIVGPKATVGYVLASFLFPTHSGLTSAVCMQGVVFGRAVKAEGRWIVLVCEVKVDGQPTLPVKADDIANKK